MFLVVKPQCYSMEMNYLSTVWLQMSVGGQLFKRFGEEVFFFIFLPNIHFGVLSQSFNIGNLFILSWQPWPAILMIHTARMSYQRIAVRLTKSRLRQSYWEVWSPAVIIRYSASTIYEHGNQQNSSLTVCNTVISGLDLTLKIFELFWIWWCISTFFAVLGL